MAGGKLRWVDDASMFVPDRALDGIVSVGACAGAFDLDRALEHARAVGRGDTRRAPVGGSARAGSTRRLREPAAAGTRSSSTCRTMSRQRQSSSPRARTTARSNT
jgi:sarcosine oxidase subunit alpha